MDLEDKKENIQPLRGGRNIEQLEYAFLTPERWEEDRKLREEAIENDSGDDPLAAWFDYVYWMEQTNPSSAKPAVLNDAIRRCVQTFENDPRYAQDRRFIKLCIKYIDTQSAPVELYNELYNRGVGTLCSDLYIAWAYYYDAVDNFAKTEEIFQKGIAAGAEPKAELEQAHTAFGFSMSQRFLHKDECSKLKFKTSLEDRRNALTSLKSVRKKHVGSVRTGLAVKSYQPGVVNQENVATNSICRNAPSGGAIVYTDEPDGGGSVAASIVHPFSSVHNEAENIVEAARLAKSGTHKKPVLFGKHQAPSFDIPMDDDIFEPIPLLVDNYGRGLNLSAKFHRRNMPQKPFELSVCVGDKMERAIPMYDKIRLYCRAKLNEEYSPEELRAYRYFLRKAVENKFVDTMNRVWGRGAEVGIRLHPLHLRNNLPNAIATAPNLNPAIDECYPNIQTRTREMYANRKEEKSIEELLVSKWTEGRINKGVDRRYHDDVCPVDMDETHVESKRISMGIARYSMAPAPLDEQQQRLRQRRSVFPTERTAAACILEETEDEISSRSVKHSNRMASQPVECDQPSSTSDQPTSRKRISNEILQQEVFKKEDCKPTPVKYLIPHESQAPGAAAKEHSPSLAVPPKFNIFVEESDEDAGKPEDIGTTSKATDQPYYPNDTCSTQMFNFFVKNRSTPLGPALRMQPLTANIEGAGGTAKRMVMFEDDELLNGGAEMPKESPISPLSSAELVTEPPNVPAPAEIVVNDENVPPVVESSTPPSTSTPGSSTCNSTQSHKQLSTIMERTETSTHSSTAVGAVTKSSGDVQTLSPEPQVSGATSNIQSSMKPADSQTVTNDGVFKVPPPSDGGIFCIHLDSTETMANIPLVIKRDLPTATESPNNPSPEAEKENQVILRSASAAAPTFAAQPLALLATTPCAGPGRLGGVFNLLDEPTFTDCQPVIGAQRNISQLAQRDMDVNSIASFRLATERTNTVPLQLVKPLSTVPELASSTLSTHNTTTNTPSTVLIQKPPNSGNSFLDLLETTFSPKASADGIGVTSGEPKASRSSFNLSDLMKTPQPKAGGDRAEIVEPGRVLSPANTLPCPDQKVTSCPDMMSIKVEKSLQLDASMELPKFTIRVPTTEPPPMQLSPVIKIELDDFPSPLPQTGSLGASTAQGKHGSVEDLNTAVFSMNINRAAMNSTVIREDGFRTPSPKQNTFAEPLAPRPPLPLKITNVRGGISGHASLLMPPGPQLEADVMADVADAEVSIYQPRPAVPQEAENWEEVDEHCSSDSDSNGYRYKAIDMDSTQMQINAYVEAQDFDPFDRQLQEAFLDQLDFMSYLATSVPTCKMVNKVQPLKKAAHVEVPDGNIFEVQRKIGQGTYGAIYCANHVATGKQFALKQERPANLWEYYICLELRSRITNFDILAGFLPIDYAIIGNNASIFISPFSRYGNILDVCNAVHSATSRNMDEFIAMIISSQILSIVDHLHSCQIIHADIKPDNFLLMAPIDLGSAVPCVQLIDFGVSIDMKAFKNDRIKFTKVITTEGFTCIEMLERKPWTYQPDLYGVAGTAHVMLFGKYMQVEKNIVNWNIKSAMPRYFKKAVWENFFAALLNIRDCDHLPNLQQLRTAFLEEIAQNERYIRGKVSEFNNVLASSK
ncbi:uncharacterized protein LOC131207111 [Anopheles bellator]|uniref:uncharacterized protein LOC131207111 n=1 Tax=Anopheles bellator TaxID=139047 RepID=UPI002648C179|nr:uncharacterized protein LOC131207111 [Anopheles bellator]